MIATSFVLGTSAQQVLGPGHYGAIVQADSANAVDVYVGGQSVTADAAATGGFRLAAGASLPMEVSGNEYLFAVAASGTPVLRVVRSTTVGETIYGSA